METKNGIIDVLMQKARDVLQKAHKAGEDFMPMAFIIKDDEIVEAIGLTFSDDEEKVQAYQEAGHRCSLKDAHEVVLVVDSLYREMNEDESDYISDNWETERPSTYPASHQQHCLIFNRVNFCEGVSIRLLKYNPNDSGITFEGQMNIQGGEGEMLTNLSYGFLLEEAIKLGDTPDDGIRKAREKYTLLRG